MTILHYIPSISKSKGGLSAYMALLTHDLGQLCELHVLTHHAENEYTLDYCTVHYLPPHLWQIRRCKSSFLQLVKQLQPDMCHVNGCWTPQCSWVAEWSNALGLPVVYTPHGMLEPYALHRHYFTRKWPAIQLYQRRSIAHSTIVHATSTMEAEHLKQLGWNDHISIVPNCIQIDQTIMRTDWKIKRRILFLSRLHPKKGLPFLLEAVHQLREEMTDYECLIVGPSEPAYLKELKNCVAHYHIDHIVRFSEPAYGADKWRLFANADILVLPTLSENFGIVITEALAAGTPVITTQETPWEEVAARQCGYWIPIGTEPLVQALKQVLQLTETQRRDMGLRGRQLVEQNYSSTHIAKQMLQLYQHTVSQHND